MVYKKPIQNELRLANDYEGSNDCMLNKIDQALL
jgi:hypothetical protein